MCTVTFIPIKDGFTLTHNRDEKISRKPGLPPQRININGTEITCPIDSASAGTWFAASSKLSICVLNGAFKKHLSKNNYKTSRGLVLLDVFKYQSFNDWKSEYVLNEIEPFTFVLVDKQTNQLFEFRWDGEQKYLQEFNIESPKIWSSSTLYPQEYQLNRELWLEEWFQTTEYTPEEALAFHHNAGNGVKESNLRMSIEGTHSTVSIVQEVASAQRKELFFSNFVNQKTMKL